MKKLFERKKEERKGKGRKKKLLTIAKKTPISITHINLLRRNTKYKIYSKQGIKVSNRRNREEI